MAKKAEVIQQVKNIFRLVVGGSRTTEEMVKAGNYDYFNRNVNSQNFPMRSRPAGERIIELIEFDYDPTSEKVLAEAEKRELERPVYEYAFDFGEQFPKKQRERPIAFLHEPWQCPRNGRLVLVLYSSSSKRYLELTWFAYRWIRYFVFAFVRE